MSKENHIWILEINLIEELNDNKEEILNSSYPEDLINDYADSWIPIYNWDVLETAQSDVYLLSEADEDETGGSIVQKIQTAIYYRLTDAGNKWLQDNQNEEVA